VNKNEEGYIGEEIKLIASKNFDGRNK